MLQAAMDLQGESITAWMNGAERAGPRGADGMANWFSPAPYGIYATTDGHVMISMSTPPDLAKALDLPEFLEFTEKDGFDRRGEVSAKVREGMALLTTEEAVRKLGAAGVWHEVVQDYDGLRSNPQVDHLKAFTEPMVMLSHPVRYDGETPPVRRAPPALGGHSREVLAEAGFTLEEIEWLVVAGVVVQSDKMRTPA